MFSSRKHMSRVLSCIRNRMHRRRRSRSSMRTHNRNHSRIRSRSRRRSWSTRMCIIISARIIRDDSQCVMPSIRKRSLVAAMFVVFLGRCESVYIRVCRRSRFACSLSVRMIMVIRSRVRTSMAYSYSC